MIKYDLTCLCSSGKAVRDVQRCAPRAHRSPRSRCYSERPIDNTIRPDHIARKARRGFICEGVQGKLLSATLWFFFPLQCCLYILHSFVVVYAYVYFQGKWGGNVVAVKVITMTDESTEIFREFRKEALLMRYIPACNLPREYSNLL